MFPNQEHGHLSVLEDGTLLITSVRVEDAGVYLCKGLSIAGTAVAKVRLDVQGKRLFCTSVWQALLPSNRSVTDTPGMYISIKKPQKVTETPIGKTCRR